MISSILICVASAVILFMGNVYQRAGVDREIQPSSAWRKSYQVLSVVLYATAFWLVRQ